MSDRIGRGLITSARVMLGEAAAARDVDGSRGALQLSFLGLALALVMDAGILSIDQSGEGRVRFFLWLMPLGLMSYAAAIAVILVLAREAGPRARFPAWLAAQNWGEAVLGAAFLVPRWIQVSMPPVRVEGAQVTGSPLVEIVIFVGLAVFTFVARYRLLVHVLGVTGVRAVWMIVAAYAAAILTTAVMA